MSATSQNGYSANDVSQTQSGRIPGSNRAIRLRKGSPGALLVHFLAWFHANIEPLDDGPVDDWGYAERPIRGQEVKYDAHGNAINLSNHASGTAADVNSTKHPLDERGTFSAANARKIRAKLLEYDGCIRWGGDYVRRADEMHFEIVRGIAACDLVLKKTTTAGKDAPMSDTEVTTIKNWITSEANRVIKENEDSNLVWAVYVNRYALQSADDEERGRAAFDARLAAGGTLVEASLAMWQVLAPLDAELAKSQANAR